MNHGSVVRKRNQVILQLEAALNGNLRLLNDVIDAVALTGVLLDELRSWSVPDLVGRLLMTRDQAIRFHTAEAHARELSDRLALPYPSVVTRMDEHWPDRIADAARDVMAPWLYMVGDPALLQRHTVGIVGSRDATPGSLHIAGQLAGQVVARDAVVVSGGARGVDSAAHRAALERGGRTVVVLAQGVGTFSIPTHWWRWVERGELTVLSEFSPYAPWESFRALQRNGTIARLSSSFVVVQAETMSGTLSAGRAALRLKRPLFVVEQTGIGAERFSGSNELIASGASPLPIGVGVPLDSAVVDTLLKPSISAPPSPIQTRMF